MRKLDLKLVGEKFNRLTVLRETSDRDKGGRLLWECRCECGTITKVPKHAITSGNTKSCGCWRRESLSQVHRAKIVGQTFGLLTVLLDTMDRNNGQIVWECQCDCGDIARVMTTNLTSGHTKSCGCLRQGTNNKRKLVGKTFGRLTVLRETTGRKWGQILWECSCECGVITEVPTRQLTSGKTKSCGCWQKEVRLLNSRNGVHFLQAIEQFGEHMDNPSETIKRLREEDAA